MGSLSNAVLVCDAIIYAFAVVHIIKLKWFQPKIAEPFIAIEGERAELLLSATLANGYTMLILFVYPRCSDFIFNCFSERFFFLVAGCWLSWFRFEG